MEQPGHPQLRPNRQHHPDGQGNQLLGVVIAPSRRWEPDRPARLQLRPGQIQMVVAVKGVLLAGLAKNDGILPRKPQRYLELIRRVVGPGKRSIGGVPHLLKEKPVPPLLLILGEGSPCGILRIKLGIPWQDMLVFYPLPPLTFPPQRAVWAGGGTGRQQGGPTSPPLQSLDRYIH